MLCLLARRQEGPPGASNSEPDSAAAGVSAWRLALHDSPARGPDVCQIPASFEVRSAAVAQRASPRTSRDAILSSSPCSRCSRWLKRQRRTLLTEPDGSSSAYAARGLQAPRVRPERSRAADLGLRPRRRPLFVSEVSPAGLVLGAFNALPAGVDRSRPRVAAGLAAADRAVPGARRSSLRSSSPGVRKVRQRGANPLDARPWLQQPLSRFNSSRRAPDVLGALIFAAPPAGSLCPRARSPRASLAGRHGRDRSPTTRSASSPAIHERAASSPWCKSYQPIVTTGRVRGARERASHIPDSLAVPS